MPISYPERIKLARIPTPLMKMPYFSEKYGVDLYIKRDDMTGMEMSGNKVRKLEFILAEAISEGADTIVTCGGLQSNHCRTTAAACSKLGLECILILREQNETPFPDGNYLLDHLFGATFRFLTSNEYWEQVKDDFPEICGQVRSKGKKPYFMKVGGSSPSGNWGYVKAFEELKQQLEELNINKASVVAADGSGGTHTGLVLGNKFFDEEFEIYGVNIIFDEGHFKQHNAGLFNETAKKYNLSFRADKNTFQFLDGYVGPGYGISYTECLETIESVAKNEGIILDPIYTGKAFHAMIREIEKGKLPTEKPIVFIHTGGLFGVFPMRGIWKDRFPPDK